MTVERDPFRDAAGGRIIRRPTQPRSNLERFSRGCKLASQLEEAAEMGTAGRRKVWEALMPEVVEMFKELLGDSLVKIEKEPSGQEPDGKDSVQAKLPAIRGADLPIIVSLEQGRG